MSNIDNKALEEDEEVVDESLTFGQKILRGFDKMGDLFVLNIYFTVSCLPIVTIGAAFTALYSVTNKMIYNKEGTLSTEYWKAFKSNLKQGIAIWLIDLLILLSIYLEYGYTLAHNDGLSKIFYVLGGFEFFLLAFGVPLQFPLLSRYENTTGRIMLNSIALALHYPGTWFKLFFTWALPVALYYVSTKALIYTWYFWCILLTALFAYFCSTFLVEFFKKLESGTEDNEGEEVNAEK